MPLDHISNYIYANTPSVHFKDCVKTLFLPRIRGGKGDMWSPKGMFLHGAEWTWKQALSMETDLRPNG